MHPKNPNLRPGEMRAVDALGSAPAAINRVLEQDLEQALTDLNTKARDGEGRMVLLYSGPITSEGLRAALMRHLANHTGDDRSVFLGSKGEEAFWHNAKLFINALLAAIAHEGGSKLNQRVPW